MGFSEEDGMRRDLLRRLVNLEHATPAIRQSAFAFRFEPTDEGLAAVCVELIDTTRGRRYGRAEGESAREFAARVASAPDGGWEPVDVAHGEIADVDLSALTDNQLEELAMIASGLVTAP
jgi:hypothetical protein